MSYFATVKIDFHDGTQETVESVTRSHISDETLHLFCKNGAMAEEEHLGSWPLVGVKKWKRETSPW